MNAKTDIKPENVWRRKHIYKPSFLRFHVRLKGYKSSVKLVSSLLPESPTASMIFTCACSGSSWKSGFRCVNRPFPPFLTKYEPTWNHPNGSDDMRLMHPGLKDMKIQETWNMIRLLVTHHKTRGNPANLRYFWDIPPGPHGLRSVGSVTFTGKLFRDWWLLMASRVDVLASRVDVSKTPVAQKLFTLKTPPNHATSKLFRLHG